MQQILCTSLIDTFDRSSDNSLFIGRIGSSSKLSLFDHGLEIRLSCLIGSSLCSIDLDSLLGRFDIRHFTYTSLNKMQRIKTLNRHKIGKQRDTMPLYGQERSPCIVCRYYTCILLYHIPAQFASIFFTNLRQISARFFGIFHKSRFSTM